MLAHWHEVVNWSETGIKKKATILESIERDYNHSVSMMPVVISTRDGLITKTSHWTCTHSA